eukprot:4063558-Pyramimonas_sp.AAC.1
MANHDLEKYYQALDKALMKFHNSKMEEINKIVQELWQQTYQVSKQTRIKGLRWPGAGVTIRKRGPVAAPR